MYELPFDYAIQAIHNAEGNVYLSYGPHQSYWPTVYIWGAKNGILTINAEDLSYYDRRIPRQALKMALDKNSVLYFTQNNWGREEQFLGTLKDDIRLFNADERLRLGDEVEREITQRLLCYDQERHALYLVRAGERDDEPSILQIIDVDSSKVTHKIQLGKTATDLLLDDDFIYIANFNSNSISVISLRDYTVNEISTGEQPIKLCHCHDKVYVLNHQGRSLQEVEKGGVMYQFPQDWLPDNVFCWNDNLIITAHNSKSVFIALFNPGAQTLTLLHEHKYPYGDTRFSTANVSFYLNGQFGDAIFDITKGKTDSQGRFWLIDYLSGRVFIIEQ